MRLAREKECQKQRPGKHPRDQGEEIARDGMKGTGKLMASSLQGRESV